MSKLQNSNQLTTQSIGLKYNPIQWNENAKPWYEKIIKLYVALFKRKVKCIDINVNTCQKAYDTCKWIERLIFNNTEIVGKKLIIFDKPLSEWFKRIPRTVITSKEKKCLENRLKRMTGLPIPKGGAKRKGKSKGKGKSKKKTPKKDHISANQKRRNRNKVKAIIQSYHSQHPIHFVRITYLIDSKDKLDKIINTFLGSQRKNKMNLPIMYYSERGKKGNLYHYHLIVIGVRQRKELIKYCKSINKKAGMKIIDIYTKRKLNHAPFAIERLARYPNQNGKNEKKKYKFACIRIWEKNNPNLE